MSKVSDTDPLDRKFKPEDLKEKGVRGKYFALASNGNRMVKLDPMTTWMFPDKELINPTLTAELDIAKPAQLKSIPRNTL